MQSVERRKGHGGFLCPLCLTRFTISRFPLRLGAFASKPFDLNTMTQASPTVLWRPSRERIARSNITRFIHLVNQRWNAGVRDSQQLYEWSVREPEQFWTAVWDFCGVVAETRGERVLVDGQKMPGAKWFPDARLNFAENLLRRRDDDTAMVFWGEDKVRRRMSYAEVYDAVSRTMQALSATGVKEGDRVAAFMPNMPETIIFMLAVTGLGAIWSSCSPDFGAQGVLDRFGQIAPKVLFAVEGYHYNGKTHDTLPRIAEIARNLPTLARTVIVSYTREKPDLSGIRNAVHLADFVGPYRGREITFRRLPFDHPLLILYSSGTSGEPVEVIVSTVSSRWVSIGLAPALLSASMYLAEVPNTVMRSSSAKSNSTLGPGWKGEPSYRSSVMPVARPEASQFHIIQPQVVK